MKLEKEIVMYNYVAVVKYKFNDGRNINNKIMIFS